MPTMREGGRVLIRGVVAVAFKLRTNKADALAAKTSNLYDDDESDATSDTLSACTGESWL